jgi:hypothetical protein
METIGIKSRASRGDHVGAPAGLGASYNLQTHDAVKMGATPLRRETPGQSELITSSHGRRHQYGSFRFAIGRLQLSQEFDFQTKILSQ